MAKVHSILTLRSQGRSFRWIARELGVHRATVSRYVHLAETEAKPPTCDVEGRPAILDRFLHNAEVITITGKSYRLKSRAGKNQSCQEKAK